MTDRSPSDIADDAGVPDSLFRSAEPDPEASQVWRDAGRPTYAAPAPDPAAVDAEAGALVLEALAAAAISRALELAGARLRDHSGGGLIGFAAAASQAVKMRRDPELAPAIEDIADALLAFVDGLLAGGPSTPTIAESQRVADALGGHDPELAPVEVVEAPFDAGGAGPALGRQLEEAGYHLEPGA